MARSVTSALLSVLVAAAVVALLYYGLQLQSRQSQSVAERFATEKTISPKVINDLYDTADALDAAILDKVDQLAYNREVDGLHQVQDVTTRELGELKTVVVPLKPLPDALNALSSSLNTVQQALATKGSAADTVTLTKNLLRLSAHLDALVDEVTRGDRNLSDDMYVVKASLASSDSRLTDLTSHMGKANDGLAKHGALLTDGLASYGAQLQDAKTSLSASIEQLQENVVSTGSLNITVKRLDDAIKGISSKLANDMSLAVNKAEFDALKATAATQSDYSALNNNYATMNTKLAATAANLKKLTDMGDLTKMTDFASLRDAQTDTHNKYAPMHTDYTANGGFVPKNAFSTLEQNYNTTAGKVDAIAKLGDLGSVFARQKDFNILSDQVGALSKNGKASATAASDGGLLANLTKLNTMELDVSKLSGDMATKVSNTEFQKEKSNITTLQANVTTLTNGAVNVATKDDVDGKVASLKTMLQNDKDTIAAGGLSRLCMDGRCLDGTAVDKLKAFDNASAYAVKTDLTGLRNAMTTANAAGGLNQLCIGPECVTADQLRTMKSPPAAAAFNGIMANGIAVTNGDPGPLIEKQYGTADKGDRYGVGQFGNGTTRTYAATAFAPATVNMSFAKGDGTFNDVVTARNNGRVDMSGSLVVSPEPGGYAPANNFMAPGSLTVGSIHRDYGQGTGGWNGSTAGLLMECKDKTEIAVHDSLTRVASMMAYDGPANRFSVGRNMGWGTTDVVAAGNVGVDGSSTVAGNSTVKGSSTVAGNSTVNGSSTVAANATVNGSSTVAGNSAVNGSSTVAGNSAVNGSSTVKGNSTVGGSFTVAGDSTVGGSSTVNGNSTVAGSATVNGSATINGGSFVNGMSKVGGGDYGTSRLHLSAEGPGAGWYSVIQATDEHAGYKQPRQLRLNPRGGDVTAGGDMMVAGSSTVNGSATVNGQFLTNNVQFNRGHTGYVNGANDRAEIANDTGSYKTLMILGNKSAGGNRRVGVWDRLDVHGDLGVTGTTKTSVLQLGDKFRLSGVGDGHGNDDWLRMFNPANNNYSGGFAAGKFWSSTGNFVGSDERLKEQIQPVSPQDIHNLTRLQPKKYILRESKEPSYGFVAQDVQNVYPDLVSNGPNNLLSMNYNGVIPLIVGNVNDIRKNLPDGKHVCIDGVCLTKQDIMKLKRM